MRNSSSCSFLSSLLIGLKHLWSWDWLLGSVLGSQWWEVEVHILPLWKHSLTWEEKATGASWGTRQGGINQSSPRFSRPNQNLISFTKPFQIPLLEINLRACMSPGPLACTFPSILTTVYLVLQWFMHMPASPTRMWVPEDRNIYEGPFDDFDYRMKDQHNSINNLPSILRWFYGKIIKTECSFKNDFHIFILSPSSFFWGGVHFIDVVREAESLLWSVQGHRTGKQAGKLSPESGLHAPSPPGPALKQSNHVAYSPAHSVTLTEGFSILLCTSTWAPLSQVWSSKFAPCLHITWNQMK